MRLQPPFRRFSFESRVPRKNPLVFVLDTLTIIHSLYSHCHPSARISSIYIYLYNITATAIAMVSPVHIPRTKIDARVSNCTIGKHPCEIKETPSNPILPSERNGSFQREVKTPSDPILPPEPSGSYEVDESVKACGFGSYFGLDTLLIANLLSFPSPWNENPPRPQLWHVVMGEDCKNNSRTTRGKTSKILPQGWNCLHREYNS